MQIYYFLHISFQGILYNFANGLEIERYKYSYEVELTNSLELKFDKKFRLTEIDD